jgi:hypothetical protein
MRALNSQHPQSLPACLNVSAWLAVFLSPTAYVLLLMIVDRLRVPAMPEGVVVFLFWSHPCHGAADLRDYDLALEEELAVEAGRFGFGGAGDVPPVSHLVRHDC